MVVENFCHILVFYNQGLYGYQLLLEDGFQTIAFQFVKKSRKRNDGWNKSHEVPELELNMLVWKLEEPWLSQGEI